MNYARLKEIMIELDPGVTEYFGDGSASDYTVMIPHHRQRFISDDTTEDRTAIVTIERYTTDPDETLIDDIVDRLEEAQFTVDDVLSFFDEEHKKLRYIVDVHVTA